MGVWSLLVHIFIRICTSIVIETGMLELTGFGMTAHLDMKHMKAIQFSTCRTSLLGLPLKTVVSLLLPALPT